MANSLPCARHQALSKGFDLLCQYLNFDDGSSLAQSGLLVQQVLRSHLVRPFFDEYRRDYLLKADEIDDIGLNELMAWCKKKEAFKSKQFTSRTTPHKNSWKPLDQAARFLVQVLQYNWKHDGLFTHGEFNPDSDDSEIEFWQAWLLLRYLQAEWEAANLDEWDDGSLRDMFQVNLSRL